ncbi:unnamed protein product [Clavelina lepadiformis]|uniref:G-protein coupled receptors family 1 profile domain-containing protein n=1 Tax=Clavelina lepadiformis TaxID=159417 RepID=A0ABP0F4P5_CLALP
MKAKTSTTTMSNQVQERVFGGKPFILMITPKIPLTKTPLTSTTTTTSTVSPNFTLNPPHGATEDVIGKGNPADPLLPEYEATICAPFPSCNPFGCGHGKAPIECDTCDSTSVGFTVFGMCILSVLIVFANILVIVIIVRTASLRRRHGYIKVSLAVSDLLVGLFVLPSGIFNLATTLYLPPESIVPVIAGRSVQTGRLAREFVQINSTASVFFGTIFVISVTTSIYNLLLLSLDRFLAVAFPLQSRSGKYFSNKRLRICLAIVWVLGLVLSSLPSFIPSMFVYGLDPTTFFYMQSVSSVDGNIGVGPIGLFSLFVLGLPYIAIVVLNLSTMVITVKKLKIRKRLSSRTYSRGTRNEQAKRMKMILDTCPEMSYGESNSKSSSWARSWLSKTISSNEAGKESRSRLESVSSIFRRKRTETNVNKNLNSRVLKMITTMVAAFTVCLCPYIIVNAMLVNGSLNCSNVAVPYIFAVYFLLLNSAMNFFIYNLWHKEFRSRLFSTFRGYPQQRNGGNAPNGNFSSISSHPRGSAGHMAARAKAQQSTSSYQLRTSGGISSLALPAKKADTQL